MIRFWVSEFDVDGIRLDAADVLDFDYMHMLRAIANEVKPDFWLMGEVIHGDYTRWVNGDTLHAVTNYALHKALYSGHNDHNYFEIAHTVKRLYEMGGNRPDGLKLYNFVDNHDVERIYTKLNNKAHFTPVHVLLYTLPGVPSIYYGSEFGIEGRKEKFSDASLRPALKYEDYADSLETNSFTKLIAALGKARQSSPELSYGSYRELVLTNRQYAFARELNGRSALVAVNNDDNSADFHLAASGCSSYVGALSGNRVNVENGQIHVTVGANSGEIWLPVTDTSTNTTEKEPVVLNVSDAVADVPAGNAQAEVPVETAAPADQAAPAPAETPAPEPQPTPAEAPTPESQPTPAAAPVSDADRDAFERGKIAGLQEAILAIMEKNGPVTDQMRRDVENNVYHDSLVNWVKSFH